MSQGVDLGRWPSLLRKGQACGMGEDKGWTDIRGVDVNSWCLIYVMCAHMYICVCMGLCVSDVSLCMHMSIYACVCREQRIAHSNEYT